MKIHCTGLAFRKWPIIAGFASVVVEMPQHLLAAALTLSDVTFSPLVTVECLPHSAFAASNINLSVFRSGGIVAQDGATWIAYFGADGEIVLGRRSAHGPWHWKVIPSRMEPRMLGDGHQSVNLGLAGDGTLHMCWGAHATPPHYAAFDAFTLEPHSLKSPFANGELASYPQFLRQGSDLLLFYRRDHSGEIIMQRFGAKTRQWEAQPPVLRRPPGADSIYIHTPAILEDAIAIGYTLRWPDLQNAPHPRVLNIDVRGICSVDRGQNWLTSRYSLASGEFADQNAPIALMPSERTLLNQGGSLLDGTNRLWLACTNADAQGNWQISLVVWSPESTVGREVVVRRTEHTATLRGRGTLALPVSRAAVQLSADRLHVIYRDGDQIVVSTARVERSLADLTWTHCVVAAGPLGAWEPVLATGTGLQQAAITFLIQHSVQAANDLPAQNAPESAMAIATLDLRTLQ